MGRQRVRRQLGRDPEVGLGALRDRSVRLETRARASVGREGGQALSLQTQRQEKGSLSWDKGQAPGEGWSPE